MTWSHRGLSPSLQVSRSTTDGVRISPCVVGVNEMRACCGSFESSVGIEDSVSVETCSDV